MQDHLKERLTGAAILVLVVVLLVPEMFRGRPAVSVEHSADTPDGLPLRTYTIDLRDTPAAQPPAVTTLPVTVAERASREALAPAPVLTAATAPTTGTGRAPPAVPASASRLPPVSTPAGHASGANAGWTVQVGSFTRRDFAERMVKQVRAKGFAVEAAGPDDRGLYRVRSAPNPERSAALALKQKMQARGLKPIINTMP